MTSIVLTYHGTELMAEGVDEVMRGWQYEGFVLEEEGQVDQHALQHLPVLVLKTTGTFHLYITGRLNCILFHINLPLHNSEHLLVKEFNNPQHMKLIPTFNKHKNKHSCLNCAVLTFSKQDKKRLNDFL